MGPLLMVCTMCVTGVGRLGCGTRANGLLHQHTLTVMHRGIGVKRVGGSEWDVSGGRARGLL